MPQEIVIASKNKGKIREIRQIYADLPVAIVEHPDLPDVVEDGDTFSANARKKAIEIARHTGKWALADDSGLEVDALNGAPGIYSARWSGGGDEANNDKLLAELREVPPPARTARYRAVVVIASPDGRVVAEADGVCDGLIGFERKGTGGFGYDPLFVVPQFGRTMAELPAETKHSISHRGEALRRLRDPLTRALSAVR
ncbi:MAG: RdgB/HAM1 family non-canonical purine NTP pyrophosphatase [Planctomycetota bacterium]|nr:MAG: RdgB/HAM1 family non-canonical purine NTP pyrophosphatase [Planctomycetota bacterium]